MTNIQLNESSSLKTLLWNTNDFKQHQNELQTVSHNSTLTSH